MTTLRPSNPNAADLARAQAAERARRYRARRRGEAVEPVTLRHAGVTVVPDRPPIAVTTKSERGDLAKIARMNARVARSAIGQREAELLADVEEKLSAAYKFDDEAWAAVTAAAQEAVRDADARIAETCRRRGIPEAFRPSLNVGWFGRGENAVAGRRAELRRVAQTRIAAAGKAAKLGHRGAGGSGPYRTLCRGLGLR